jgi:heterotetrameric sarcosine oxidase gamma subunit
MIPKVSASMLEHQKPFDFLVGSHADQPGLRVSVSSVGLLLMQSASDAALQEALMSEIELQLPPPQRAIIRGEYSLLWLTPSEWLLELPTGAIESLQSPLTRRLAMSLAVVTDVSDAFACYQINGVRATEFLASGCGLDFRTQSFSTGRVARTLLADVPAIIWKTGEPQRFRCLVDRSFAAHLQDWLTDVSRP